MEKETELKIDLDMLSLLDVVQHLSQRLRYLHYKNILDYRNIEKITVVKKMKYSLRIYLKKPLSVDHAIIFQLILGSDWKKESYSFLNYHILKKTWWNRMFDIKRYPDGSVIEARVNDITDLITPLVMNKHYKVDRFFKQINELCEELIDE